MNVRNRAAGVVAATALFSALAVAPASAIDNIKPFGQRETIDTFGSEIGYTVTKLSPSSDTTAYPVTGRLYEATVTVDAVQGAVAPVIPFFSARAENGDNYVVLANAFASQGLSSASLPPGGSSTGKLYFDVVGSDPNSVVYNDGSHDLLGWVTGANEPVAGGSTGGSSDTTSTGGGAGSGGVAGSTGPNFTSPSTTAGDQGGTGSIEGGSEGGPGSSGSGSGSGSSGGGSGAGG